MIRLALLAALALAAFPVLAQPATNLTSARNALDPSGRRVLDGDTIRVAGSRRQSGCSGSTRPRRCVPACEREAALGARAYCPVAGDWSPADGLALRLPERN
jgi:hypothetical protein